MAAIHIDTVAKLVLELLHHENVTFSSMEEVFDRAKVIAQSNILPSTRNKSYSSACNPS
jgi:hypothetical protein